MLLLGALLGCTTAAAQPRFDFRATPGHLSKDVRPAHYRLAFDLDPARDDFSATASIALRVQRRTAVIELHAHEIEADSVRLIMAGRSRMLRLARNEQSQTWLLTPEDGRPIEPGPQRLEIAYRGVVHRSGEGLFRAQSTSEGKTQPMLATQLEAIHARTLFPAFDEPAFRASFEIDVRAPEGYEVLSNMPRKAAPVREAAGAAASAAGGPAQASVLHRFAPTPPMPSYLVAIAVGRFDVLEGRAAGVPLRLLTAPGKREQARYALDATRQVLPYYTRYFGQRFTLPRLDQLAVPSTRWGAMEDWGLISYSEDTLLFDPAMSSQQTQRQVFDIVAHEIAHQWFGNLVTAASWNEIWLNEAFATWLAEKVADRFNPSWQVALHRRTPIDRTMQRDASRATRAIRSGPVTEATVFDVFDNITYSKGGAVLSMLEQWLGEAVFQRGLAAYIAQRKLSNATAGDLWFHIGRAARRDVASVAASWTDQPGFPLVRVRAACEGGRVTVLHLEQRRFGLDAAQAESTQLWQIPVRIARGANRSTLLLKQARETHRLPGCSDEPLVVNAAGVGFYRVEYAGELLNALQRRFAQLNAADQVTLLSDTFALAQAGALPMQAYFGLLARVPGVQGAGRSMLLTQAAEALMLLDSALAGSTAQAALRAAGRELLAPELARLGWEPRSEDGAQILALRATLIEKLAHFEHAATIVQARERFDRDASGQATLPASTRSAVTFAVGMHADSARFDVLVARLKAARGEEERWLYAAALAAGRDAQRVEEVLELGLTGGLPSNIATSIAGMVARKSPFGERAYRFALDRWRELAALTGRQGRAWLLPGAAEGFNDTERAAQLVADQRAATGADGDATAGRIAARIELLAQIKQREGEALATLLAAWRPVP